MGRMFRIITEGGTDYPGGGPSAVAIADGEPYVGGGAPFIEVGGPNGPVHSFPKPVPKAVGTIDPPKPVAPPRAAEDHFISVALHQIAPRPAAPLVFAIAADVVAFHHPDHPVSAEYLGLAADLRKQSEVGPKALLMTAAGSDHGTTTVVL